MALNGCSSGLLVVVTLLLLALQYFVPEQYTCEEPPPAQPDSAAGACAWLDGALVHLPLLGLFMFVTFLLGMSIYLCGWIQIKLMERRIVKLNQYLMASVERLCAMDARQAQLEGTLMMVQNATTENNGGRGL